MKHLRWSSSVGLAMLFVAPAWSEEIVVEKFRYVRAAGDKFVTECEFVITPNKSGWSITSRTGRGSTKMEVESHYDSNNRLTSAKAALATAEATKSATVKVKDGMAIVERKGAKPAEFEVPKGTIVTSAPDWTDVFLLCRQYDRTRRGKQEFPALWIHPDKPARRLTFTIESQGIDQIAPDGINIELTRYHIRIRDGSAYTAWADPEGRMVRLIPMQAKGAAAGMILEGFEKSAPRLSPSK